jgi:dienelactone hydrolase
MKKISFALIIVILFVVAFTSSCEIEEDRTINYQTDNSFTVITSDTEAALIYMPEGKDPDYGIIFYVGTFLSPDVYPVISSELASQGYLVVIPKVPFNTAYLSYAEEEAAFSAYPNVQFFIGGHSQGGGAALRRAYENSDKVLGAVLYSPLCYNNDTLINTDMPVLLIEAENDNVLTEAMKEDSRSRLKEGYAHYIIEGGNHMGYSDMLFPADGEMTISKEEMQQEVAANTLQFLKESILNA